MIWTIIGICSAVGFISYLLILAAYEKGRSDAAEQYIMGAAWPKPELTITDKDYPPVERRHSTNPADIIQRK